MQMCTKCHETKPANSFNRDKTKADGLQFRCKVSDMTARLLMWDEHPQRTANHVSYSRKAGAHASLILLAQCRCRNSLILNFVLTTKLLASGKD